jgi:predicted metal-binding membrane protein
LTQDTALTVLLKRDRVVVVAALAVLTLVAWAYVLWLYAHMAMPMTLPAAEGPVATGTSDGMAGMDMSGANGALTPSFRAWGPTDFAFTFTMWSVMMVGMMTPSVAPMVLLYAAAGRKAADSNVPLAPTGWFFAGYLTVWVAFSALATFAQWALSNLALLTPMMATSSAVLGGSLLVAVGLYQWTPLKGACLRECQAPLGFLMAHGGFRAEPLGAVRFGIRHGAYCLGCCFGLMALLFVGGIMNLLWIAGLAILVLFEKIIPTGRLVPRVSGALIGAAGIWLLVRAVVSS